jgi:hypothetical protein
VLVPQFGHDIFFSNPLQFISRHTITAVRRVADKSLAFYICSTTKRFFLDVLKKLEQRSHKRVELKEEYVEQINFFIPVACCFLYKAKDFSVPSYFVILVCKTHFKSILSAKETLRFEYNIMGKEQ